MPKKYPRTWECIISTFNTPNRKKYIKKINTKYKKSHSKEKKRGKYIIRYRNRRQIHFAGKVFLGFSDDLRLMPLASRQPDRNLSDPNTGNDFMKRRVRIEGKLLSRDRKIANANAKVRFASASASYRVHDPTDDRSQPLFIGRLIWVKVQSETMDQVGKLPRKFTPRRNSPLGKLHGKKISPS